MKEDTCPYCQNTIRDDEALRCLYCGEKLDRQSGFMGQIKKLSSKTTAIIILIIVLLSFILLVSR